MLIVLLAPSGPGFAQQDQHSNQRGVTVPTVPKRPETLPPGTIDGSKTPELIPDATAIRAFLMSTVPLDTAIRSDAGQYKQFLNLRSVAALRLAGSEAEAESMRDVLRGFHADVLQRLPKLESLRTSSVRAQQEQYIAEHKLLGDAALEAFRRLREVLKTDTAKAALDEHIKQVKTRMRIIPPPQM
jgi:hypothetical protein